MNLEKITLIEVFAEGEYECRGEKYYAFGIMNTETLNNLRESNKISESEEDEDTQIEYTEYDLTVIDSAKNFLEHLMRAIPNNSEEFLLDFIEEADEDAFNEMGEKTEYVTNNFKKSSEVVLSMGELNFNYQNI
jgi:hypothetical protein